MNPKFGPSRRDVVFRFWFSIAGLGLVVAALLYRGLPVGPAGVEAIGIALIFFGGTTLWSLRKLIKRDYSDGL